MSYYYLHVWTSNELDERTKIVDRNVHPVIIDDVGLELHDWPADDLFCSFPAFFTSDRLKSKIVYAKFTGIEFSLIKRVCGSLNFKANYPKDILPNYFLAKINGQPGKDDFGLWKKLYLVVSEKALIFLRDNHVTHAQSCKIEIKLDEFFKSEILNFWKKINML